MNGLTDKNIAALAGAAIMANILLDDRTWTCRYCQAQTTVHSELCTGCGLEDCNQGTGRPVPVFAATEIQRARGRR